MFGLCDGWEAKRRGVEFDMKGVFDDGSSDIEVEGTVNSAKGMMVFTRFDSQNKPELSFVYETGLSGETDARSRMIVKDYSIKDTGIVKKVVWEF